MKRRKYSTKVYEAFKQIDKFFQRSGENFMFSFHEYDAAVAFTKWLFKANIANVGAPFSCDPLCGKFLIKFKMKLR